MVCPMADHQTSPRLGPLPGLHKNTRNENKVWNVDNELVSMVKRYFFVAHSSDKCMKQKYFAMALREMQHNVVKGVTELIMNIRAKQ